MASRDIRVTTFGAALMAKARKEFRAITVTSSKKQGQYGFRTTREINSVIADAFGLMAEHWHKHFRPKHFKQGAYAEYGYKARSKKYNKAKRKHYGHSDPLVLSGHSRTASETYRIVKSVNGARVVMPLVKAFNFKPPKSQINMREEFLATSEREKAVYRKIARDHIRKALKTSNVKIRINL